MSRPELTQTSLLFVERYNRLQGITQEVIESLISGGVEVLIRFICAGGGLLDLGLARVAALLPETASAHARDHLITVHLAAVESHLYRHGYCLTGSIIRIMAGNYGVAKEEEKQSIIQNGFPFKVGTVSSAEELVSLTPLKRVTDAEYSELYEKLVAAWGKQRQKEVAEMMETLLRRIHDHLPPHKIGENFRRTRNGHEEPLPLYVRNEIHHPTKEGLPESAQFQQDKNIGYAIMEAWLSEDE